MTPDPSREWYVYFKEQEMGPFLEPELQKKLHEGELDASAFVFTEGMSDWTAIDELEFLVDETHGVLEAQWPESSEDEKHSDFKEDISQTIASRSMSVEKLGAEVKTDADEEKKQQEDLTDLEKRIEASPVGKAAPRKTQMLRWAFMGFVLLFVVGVVLDFAQLTPGWRPGFVDLIMGPKKPTTQLQSDAPMATGEELSPKGDLEILWSELNELRNSADRQGPPFRISTVLLSPERPIVVGAISPLIEADKIHVAIFPESQRSLYAMPPLWWLEVPVVGGYFSIGPLTSEGAPLPVGSYRIMAQGLGKFFGSVSFEVGKFPVGPDLEVRLKSLQNQKALLAVEEQKELEQLYRDLDGLLESLRVGAVRHAIKGAPQRAAWRKTVLAWNEAYAKTVAELNETSMITFYPDLRIKLDNFSKELLKAQGLMDLYNQSGRAAFEARAGRRYSELWDSLQKDRDFLKTDLLDLSKQTKFEAFLNEEAIKARLLERK